MFKFLLMLCLCLSCPLLEAFKHRASSLERDVCLGYQKGEFAENPKDCHQFYLCGEQGESTLASCPHNSMFNALTKLCDRPENVKCTNKANLFVSPAKEAITTTTTASKADQYCFNLYAIQRNTYALIYLPHPSNCRLYYMCYHGLALLQACSSGLYWNSNLGKCDLPSQVECSAKSNTATIYQDDVNVLDAGMKCPLYREHIFPNIERCDSFIYCINGKTIQQICPFYQHFDVESGRCKWRVEALCVKDLNSKYRSYTL